MDSGNVQGESSSENAHLRITEEQRYSSSIDSRRQSTPLLEKGNIITASLKIPLQSSSSGPLLINLDDPDIPYIEDSAYTVTSDGRQQMPIGILRNAPVVPPRRRQRSVSGSDSSLGSVQPGSVVHAGYDSAVGSSATFSSPPRNTPSSIGSSGDNVFSSPPSWASTPPTSPDSTQTIVNYIPDDGHAVYSRMTVPIKPKPGVSTILQKVKFTSAHELLQKPKTVEVIHKPTHAFMSEVIKSASSPVVAKEIKSEKFSPSISSIGGAVLRSRTADFERMMKEETKVVPVSDKKKYVKRRYTDSRHPTRHIPDAETLAATSTTSTTTTTQVPIEDSEKGKGSSSSRQSIQVYKRRELIASVPKEKRGFFS